MRYGPDQSCELSSRLGHPLKLRSDRNYTITTKREKDDSAEFALVIYRIRGRKKSIFFQLDDIKPATKHVLKFNTPGDEGSLLITHWEKRKGKWIQMATDKKPD
jgi:hypothetical protein